MEPFYPLVEPAQPVAPGCYDGTGKKRSCVARFSALLSSVLNGDLSFDGFD